MLGSPSVSKQYLGYCSPVSGCTRRAGQKTDESWVLMRGRQNYIPEPSFHPLPDHYAAVNPFLKSLTCRWRLLGFRIVTPSYFSRNRRKQQRIAGFQFALFYQKNPPYSGRKKNMLMLEPIMASAATLGPLPQESCLRSALAPGHPHSSSASSLLPPARRPSPPLLLLEWCRLLGEMASPQGGRLISRDSRQVKTWPLQHRERDFETLLVSWQKQSEQIGFDFVSYFKSIYILHWPISSYCLG